MRKLKNSKDKYINKWIGLVQVSAKKKNTILNGSLEAFVNVVVWANDKEMFYNTVSDEAKKMDLKIEEVEWSEPIYIKAKENKLEKYLLDNADKIKKEKDCIFGVFHTWENDE